MTQDKLAHAFAGIAIAALAYPFGLVLTGLMLILGALCKELVWDKWLRHGTAEVRDAMITIAGGALYVAWIRIVT